MDEREWLLEQRRWRDDPQGLLRWAIALQLQNEKGSPMEWRDRRFLVEPMCDMHPWQVVVKCTQIGMSTVQIFKALFSAQVLARGIIYTLPTAILMQQFNATKIEPMLTNNPRLRPTATDSATMRVYEGAGFSLFRGTKGETQDITITADLIIADEADRSDLSVLEGLESRLTASPYKGQWWFTNPTRPNVGTDVKWLNSDQRRWHITCPHCTELQLLDFWDNIDRERRAFVCRRCRGNLSDHDRRNGRWIATHPGRKWHGYHINQLMAPWMSAGDILDLESKSKEYFFNFVLGLPVIGEGISVDPSLIQGAWLETLIVGQQKFMGVDIGGGLHVVIGNEHGITKLAYLEGEDKWGDLERLMEWERINLCVIDNAPADKQVQFQKKYPGRVFRCIYDYNDKRKASYEVDGVQGVVNAHRTRIIDETLGGYASGDIKAFVGQFDHFFAGTGKPGVIENCLVGHWSTLYVVGADGQDVNVVKKDRMGNVIRTWENAGPDHFAHANVYYWIARQARRGGHGTATVPSDRPKAQGYHPLREDDSSSGDWTEAT